MQSLLHERVSEGSPAECTPPACARVRGERIAKRRWSQRCNKTVALRPEEAPHRAILNADKSRGIAQDHSIEFDEARSKPGSSLPQSSGPALFPTAGRSGWSNGTEKFSRWLDLRMCLCEIQKVKRAMGVPDRLSLMSPFLAYFGDKHTFSDAIDGPAPLDSIEEKSSHPNHETDGIVHWKQK